MEITKEFLQARMAEFEQERNQHLALANRFEGALIALRVVLDELSRSEEEEDEDEVDL